MSELDPEATPEAAEPAEPIEHAPLSAEGLKQRFAADALSVLEFRGELTLVVPGERIVEVCRRLRDDPEYRFNVLSDLVAVDHLPRQPRFDLNYHLLSIPDARRLRVKVMLPGPDPAVESVTSVWGTANWWEREVYDLMVLDVQMPGIDGYEVCRRLRDDPTLDDLRIIMLTSSDDKHAAFEAGVDDYLNKDIDLLNLPNRVKLILEMH